MANKYDIAELPELVQSKANEANFITVNDEGRYVVTIDDFSFRDDPDHFRRQVENLDLSNACKIAELFGGKDEKDITNGKHVFGRGSSYIRFSFDDKITAARYLDVALDYRKYLKMMIDKMFNGEKIVGDANLFFRDLLSIYLNEEGADTKFLRDPLKYFGYTKEDIIKRAPEQLKSKLSACTKQLMLNRLAPTLADLYNKPMQVSLPRPVDIGFDELGLRHYTLIGIRTHHSEVFDGALVIRPLLVDHNGNERCDGGVGPTADQWLDIFDSLSDDEKVNMHYFMSGHAEEYYIEKAIKGLTTDSTCKGLTYQQQRLFIDYAYSHVGKDCNEQRSFLEQLFDKTIRGMESKGVEVCSGWIESARKEIADLVDESTRQLPLNENRGIGLK